MVSAIEEPPGRTPNWETLEAVALTIWPADGQFEPAAGMTAFMKRMWLLGMWERDEAVVCDGLRILNARAVERFGAPLHLCPADERAALLLEFERIPHAATRRCMSTLVKMTLSAALRHPQHYAEGPAVGWEFIGWPVGVVKP